MTAEPDLAAVGAAIGNRARAEMLIELLGGRALTAGELARTARVSPSSASAHLATLTASGLLAIEKQGRHRYYRLAGREVAEALEALEALGPPQPAKSLAGSNRHRAERAARSCYDHMAGALGVAVTDRLCELGALDPSSLSLMDPGPFGALGVNPDAVAGGRRPMTRSCLDWSERRPHLAGALGAALLETGLERGWLERRRSGRALLLTPTGRDGFADAIGLRL